MYYIIYIYTSCFSFFWKMSTKPNVSAPKKNMKVQKRWAKKTSNTLLCQNVIRKQNPQFTFLDHKVCRNFTNVPGTESTKMDQADNTPISQVARILYFEKKNGLVGLHYVGLFVILLKLPQFPGNIIHPSE